MPSLEKYKKLNEAVNFTNFLSPMYGMGAPHGAGGSSMIPINMYHPFATAGYASRFYGGIEFNRFFLYDMYDRMDYTDPLISTVLDIIADECTIPNENGNIVDVVTKDIELAKAILSYLDYVINIEKNAYPIIRNMIKYGDMFLHILEKGSDGTIEKFQVVSPYIFSKRYNPETDTWYYVITDVYRNVVSGYFNEDIPEEDVIHFSHKIDTNFFPYGRSYLESARAIWNQLRLMEDALMLYRVVRSVDRRVFYVDVGNVPPDKINEYLTNIAMQYKRDYWVRNNQNQFLGIDNYFSIESILKDYFIPRRGDRRAVEIDILQGSKVDLAEDVEYMLNRLISALKVPKAFIGYEGDVNAKNTLATQDIKFNNTIKRIQGFFVEELERMVRMNKEFADQDFRLVMNRSNSIVEGERFAVIEQRIGIAERLKGWVREDWIYSNILQIPYDLKPQEEVAEAAGGGGLFDTGGFGEETTPADFLGERGSPIESPRGRTEFDFGTEGGEELGGELNLGGAFEEFEEETGGGEEELPFPEEE
ncbi:portal protein [Rhodothermus phage RM378]|uniref:portal protein n=1 Tax=Rhodothermus phage RM378 TaxID=148943 RepID=UPI000018F630|nr:portal protein [Rhodothermus phage RM378]